MASFLLHGIGAAWRRAPAQARRREGTVTHAGRIDAHVHVWAPSGSKRFPYKAQMHGAKGVEPPVAGSVDLLMAELDCNKARQREAWAGRSPATSTANRAPLCPSACGTSAASRPAPQVEVAVAVQAGVHGFDHSYLVQCARKHPGRLACVALADPRENADGAAKLAYLVEEEGFCGVRFNPQLWPRGAGIADEEGRVLFALAGELGVPVGFALFDGVARYEADVRALLRHSPATPAVIDHVGFCRPGDEAACEALLALAEVSRCVRGLHLSKTVAPQCMQSMARGRIAAASLPRHPPSKHPQVHVKLSGLFRCSERPAPYEDLAPLVRRVFDAFGKERVLFGTDWPWTFDRGGYDEAWDVLGSAALALSEEEVAWAAEKTARRLYRIA